MATETPGRNDGKWSRGSRVQNGRGHRASPCAPTRRSAAPECLFRPPHTIAHASTKLACEKTNFGKKTRVTKSGPGAHGRLGNVLYLFAWACRNDGWVRVDGGATPERLQAAAAPAPARKCLCVRRVRCHQHHCARRILSRTGASPLRARCARCARGRAFVHVRTLQMHGALAMCSCVG